MPTPAKLKANGSSGSQETAVAELEVKRSASPSIKTDRPPVRSSSKSTIKLTDFLKGKTVEAATQAAESKVDLNEPFTAEQLHLVWTDFSEHRKKYQAEYQLLSQPYEIRGSQIIIYLLSTVQETLLSNFRSDLIAYLRTNLKNNTILVAGELKEAEEKQMLYTPRDKFDYLLEKNPLLQAMRDRLGLDPDF
jgi:DNA polymerase-3 subunit gamma/tau